MAHQQRVGPMPQIGYGTWNRDGMEAYDGVRCALDVGYRHIDTAEGYRNEEFVGRAIAESGVPRSASILTSSNLPSAVILDDALVNTDEERIERINSFCECLRKPSGSDPDLQRA